MTLFINANLSLTQQNGTSNYPLQIALQTVSIIPFPSISALNEALNDSSYNNDVGHMGIQTVRLQLDRMRRTVYSKSDTV